MASGHPLEFREVELQLQPFFKMLRHEQSLGPCLRSTQPVSADASDDPPRRPGTKPVTSRRRRSSRNRSRLTNADVFAGANAARSPWRGTSSRMCQVLFGDVGVTAVRVMVAVLHGEVRVALAQCLAHTIFRTGKWSAVHARVAVHPGTPIHGLNRTSEHQ